MTKAFDVSQDQPAMYFETVMGHRYRLTGFRRTEDGRLQWLQGYRIDSRGLRFETSRTPGELTPESLAPISEYSRRTQ